MIAKHEFEQYTCRNIKIKNQTLGTVLVTWAKPNYKPHDKTNLVFWKSGLFKL